MGNPIHVGTGNKFEEFILYEAAGAPQLRFTLYYNSSFQGGQIENLGPNWRHTFGGTVERDLDGNPNVVAVTRADGKILGFAKSGSSWVADPDINDLLTELTDAGGTTIGWQYKVAANDSVESYDAAGKLTTIVDRAGLSTTLQYSDASTPNSIAPKPGLLIQATDHVGRSIGLRYNSFARLSEVIDPAQSVYGLSYSANADLTTILFPDSHTRTFHYDEPGNILFYPTTYPDYNGGKLTGITDENSQRFATFRYTSTYGSNARAFYSEHAGGVNAQSVSIPNDPQTIAPNTTYSSSAIDSLGASRTYSFQSILGEIRVTQVSQPDASGGGVASRSTAYDAKGNISSKTDWNGNRTNYAYDLARNLQTSRTEGLTSAGATTPQTRTISTQWDTNFRLPTVIAEPLRITTNVYDPDGSFCGTRGALCSRSIQATTDANGSLGFGATPVGAPRTWSYTYNANGSVLTANGPRTDVSDVTTYAYYANDDLDLGKRGNLHTVTNARGHVTEVAAYNAHGQPLTIVDANGLTTTLVYDPRLRLTSRTVGSETTSYEYDGVGQLTKITLPDGSFLTYSYDAAHRLTGMQDNLGNRIAYTLDAMGNRTQEEVRDPANALAQTRSRVFNNLNRLFQEIGAAAQVTEYAYDNQGNVTSVKDPLNKVTANAYDALNRLRQVTDPALGVTQYAYNGLDALTQVTDPRSLTTSYTVDGLGNLTLQQSPDTGDTSNTYDAAGNLLTQTDAKNQVTTYAYDPLNRVTLITFHDGLKQAYAYDAGANGLGRLSSITETDSANQVTSVIAYAYDAYGRVTSGTRTLGGQSYVTAYSYNGFGRMSGMTYPSGRTVTYGFDVLGRINQVSTAKDGQSKVVVQDVTYHPFGGVTGYIFGNGQVYSRGVDRDGRIYSYSLGAANFTIGFDDASRITGITETGNPSNANTYGYDSVDRLTQAILPFVSYGYSYDAVGNRSTKTAGANTDTYAYSETSNRLASITPSSGPMRSFSFDANGSTLADGRNTYAYDSRGRMVQAVSSIGTTTYHVNALGQRVRKANSLNDMVFHHDARGRLIAEATALGAPLREYVLLDDIPVAVVQDGTNYFVHTDHLNTPRLVANQQGQPVWRLDQQEPFGVNVPDENPSGLGVFDLPLRLPGQYFDKETNLHYNYFRDYDPATGRYPQADPLGITTTPRPTPTTRLNHLYAYVDGNPVSRTDRYGLQSTACCSYGTCYSKCIDDRLIDPTIYAYDLLALGAAYGIGATPFYGGILSAAEVGGAWAGGYIGAYFGGAAGAKVGVTAGIAAGGGILAGVGIVGAGLAGYAIGSAAYCAARCGTDRCYYQ